jgi:hypothetical protein
MDISHDHIDFGPQIPFLGSWGQFLHFLPPKVSFLTTFVEFQGETKVLEKKNILLSFSKAFMCLDLKNLIKELSFSYLSKCEPLRA